MKSIPAGKFKDECLKLLDRVKETRQPLIVTKRGRPIAQVVPCASLGQPDSLEGSILAEKGDPFGTGESWDADVP